MIAEVSFVGEGGHRQVKYVRLTVAENRRNARMAGTAVAVYVMTLDGFRRRVQRDGFGKWYYVKQGKRVPVKVHETVPPGVKIEGE